MLEGMDGRCKIWVLGRDRIGESYRRLRPLLETLKWSSSARQQRSIEAEPAASQDVSAPSNFVQKNNSYFSQNV